MDMLTQNILEIAAQIAPGVKDWPRRQPGLLMVGGKVLRYADMHSFFYQVKQIFGERLYGFRSDDPAPRILDCGAHIGLASLFFKECYPAARIHAFEADAVLAELCRANFAAFGVPDIAVEAKAVWTHGGGVRFAGDRDDAGHVSETGQDVPSVALKDLLAEPVDLLKLDVEGAEFEVLASCGDALKQVRRMVIEVHAMHMDRAPVGKMLAHLENLGFRYTLADLHAAVWIPKGQHPPFSAIPTDKYIFTVFAWR